MIAVFFALTFAIGSPLKNYKVLDATAALAIISGGAVVIERILEGLWTLADMTFGSSWPNGPLAKRLDTAVKDVTGAVNGLAAGDKNWQSIATAAQDDIGKLQAVADQLAKAKDTYVVGQVAAAVSQQIADFRAKYPALASKDDLNTLVDTARKATDDLQTFLNTFQGNPTRKLLSLALGGALGIVASYFLWLNIYQAAIGGTQSAPDVWVPITGLIIGLGSSPTHEVIQAIQGFKQAQKSS